MYYVCSIGSGQDLGDQNTSPKSPCTSICLQFLQRSTSTSGRIDCRLKWDLIAEYNSIVPSQQRPVKLLSFASRTARPFIHSPSRSFVQMGCLIRANLLFFVLFGRQCDVKSQLTVVYSLHLEKNPLLFYFQYLGTPLSFCDMLHCCINKKYQSTKLM